MVEVFKTSVTTRRQATMLLERIQKTFMGFEANFDLDDCDNILRVESNAGLINASHIIELLSDYGFTAEVLPDEPIEFTTTKPYEDHYSRKQNRAIH